MDSDQPSEQQNGYLVCNPKVRLLSNNILWTYHIAKMFVKANSCIYYIISARFSRCSLKANVGWNPQLPYI